ATDSEVSTLAGIGGARGPGLTSSQPTATRLAYPMGGALDTARNVLYVADTFNNVVRAIDLTHQTMATVAGTGTAGYAGTDEGKPATQAALSFPTGLAVDAAGNLFIADTYNSRVREVVGGLRFDGNGRVLSVGSIFTVAGTGRLGFSGENGDARQADLYFPYGVAVGDYLHRRVRRVDDAGQAVATLSGIGSTGLKGDAGPADAAEVDGPRGLSMLADSGAMLVADSFNSRVRWLGVTQAGIQRTQVNFDPTNLAGRSQPQSVTVTSTGSGLLVMGAVDLGADRNNFYLDPLKNTCAQARLEP